MGNLFGGGESKSNTVTNQQYTADPTVQAAGTSAINAAQTASQHPFDMPVAPVAGFSPLQQQAFNQYQALQGQMQPFVSQAQNLYNQSGSDLTGDEINKFYNPMASNVFAAMNNAYGADVKRATGNAISQAGGVGADRIGVTQANLANKHDLALGQTGAGLYFQAFQNALAQRALQSGAAQGLMNVGLGNFQTGLQGTGALYGAGQAQQQQNQAELNAPYQNKLAEIAYRYQNPQYLAGIVGGLGNTLNHSQSGVSNTVSTPASPSIFSQLGGLALGATGLAMGFPGLGAGIGSIFSGFGNPGPSTAGQAGSPYYGPTPYAKGGAIEHYDAGGDTSSPWAGLKTTPGQSMWDFIKANPIPGMGGGQAPPIPAKPFPMAEDPVNAGGLPSPIPTPPMPVAKAAPKAFAQPVAAATPEAADPGLEVTKLPYPNATKPNWGSELSRSPWMALVNAGATMASTPGGIGTSLGKGMLAGSKALEEQNKQAHSDEELNNKARALYQTAQNHLDEYNKMTPYQRASLALKNKELDQNETGTGTDVAGRALHMRALQYYKLLKSDVKSMNIPDAQLQAKAYEMAKGAGTAPVGGGPGGNDATTALPDPGPGGRVKGKWYIGPSGQPQQWLQ